MGSIFLVIFAAVFFVVVTLAFMGWKWAAIAAAAVVLVYVVYRSLP